MTEPPNILDVLTEYVEEVKTDFLPYATAGTGIALVMLPYSMVVVFIVYGAMFVGAMPGIAMEDENVLILGMITAPFLAIFASSFVLNLITIPMHASLLRDLSAHQEREPGTPTGLGFASCFSTVTQEPARPLFYTAVHVVLYGVLAMFCLFPGLVFLVVTDLAWPLVVVDGLSPLDAMKRAAAHFRDHVAWHLGYTLILFSMAFVLAYIPFIGAFLTPGLVGGWRLWAYRRIRQDLLAA
ncbi:MAG: hypothetical protein R3F61_18725 [Myxococcota bacterium]